MENNISEKDKEKNKIIWMLTITVIILLLVCTYFVFIKKDKEEPVKEEEVTVKHMTLGDTNEEITINNKKINLKLIDSTLYINDVKQEEIMLEGNIFVTNKYVLIAGVGQYGYAIDYAIDENGKVLSVYKTIVGDVPWPSYQVNNIRVENGKIVADYFHESCNYSVDENDNKNKICESKIEFVYDGNYLNMVEVSLPETQKPLTRFELTDTNSKVNFNGKIVTLRNDENKIYFNDKLVKEFSDYTHFGVFVSDKYIFIHWVGAQCYPVFIGAIDTNGNYVEVVNKDYIPIFNVYEENNNFVAKGYECPNDYEDVYFDVNIAYDNNKITITRVK